MGMLVGVDSAERIARRVLTEGLASAPTGYVHGGVPLALASHQEWRAVFVFELARNGDWLAELPLFRANATGGFDQLSEPGTEGTGWRGLYSVAPDDFCGAAMITLISGGQDADDSSGTLRFVRGWCGFARSDVASVLAIGEHHTTIGHVSPMSGAFVVITLDEDPIELQALNASDGIVGSERHDRQ